MILSSVLERSPAALQALLRFSAVCSRLDQLCPTITAMGLPRLTRTISTAVRPPAMSASWQATPTGYLTVEVACLLAILWLTGWLRQVLLGRRTVRAAVRGVTTISRSPASLTQVAVRTSSQALPSQLRPLSPQPTLPTLLTFSGILPPTATTCMTLVSLPETHISRTF